MKRIGIQRTDYTEKNTILSSNSHRVIFEVVQDDLAQLEPMFLKEMQSSWLLKRFSASPKPGSADCFHYWNTLPVTEVPFVTTFETSLPRWYGCSSECMSIGLRVMASDCCRRLFALSHNALALNGLGLSGIDVRTKDKILSKIEVLYPPQQVRADDSFYKKFEDSTLRVAFVASDFLRKGGFELVEAVDALANAGLQIHLSVASSMAVRNEKWPWNIDGDRKIRKSLDTIVKRPSHFSLTSTLSHESVLQLFESCHISALPSFHDTFGFSVLEAQANACPVLTTNQRAFPEINSPETGLVVDLPVDAHNQLNLTPQNFEALSAALLEGITRSLCSAYSQRGEGLASKAAKSIGRLRKWHDPRAIEDSIFAWY
jgi:glycosyltransferase involved in cell wall biosynthesis